ncbi:4627_t:CDS:1, partial [Paraglomus occultum]
EAEQFAEEDRIQKERIEARNALENFAYTLKTSAADDGDLGKKLNDEDKQTIRDAIKKTLDWFEEHSNSATKEDFDEKKEELQAVVNPITSKLYQESGSPQEPLEKHDEL